MRPSLELLLESISKDEEGQQGSNSDDGDLAMASNFGKSNDGSDR